MEKFENNIDLEWDITKETKAELSGFQKELMKENEKEVEAIKNAISSLKSFKNFPLIIKYPESSKEKIDQKKFPQKLDIRPKPSWNKRKNDKSEIVNIPDPLMIYLDDRKFTITPDIGTISDVKVDQWNIALKVSKFGLVLWNEIYNPERMTKLLIILWTHKSDLNTDIEWTPWAIVKEVK